jgi:hypothetical protein
MIYKLLPYILVLLCLTYYVKSDWPGIKNKPVILGLLVTGALLFIIGLAIISASQQLAQSLKVFGACLFFTAVAINISRINKE